MIKNLFGLSPLVLYIYISNSLLQFIWPAKIDQRQAFYIFCLEGAHILSYILSNLMYFIIYSMNHPFFEKYRTENKAWPWQENLQNWIKIRNKTINNYILNTIVSIVIAIWQSSIVMTARMDTLFPSYFEIGRQLVFFLLAQDLVQYFSHTLMHHSSIYRYIHKQHHEYNIVVSLCAEYAHPVEFILGNVIPVAIGPLILGSQSHLITQIIWIGWTINDAVSQHSGYQFPWEPYPYIPFGATSDYHSKHHSINTGNYSARTVIWDVVFGTQIDVHKKQ